MNPMANLNQMHLKKTRTLLAALALFTTGAFAQPDPKTMDNYVFTLIWARPDRPTLSKEENAKIMEGHMAHIGSMAEQGALVAAGPANAPGSRLRGIFVFKAPMAQAKELANADPTVKQGIFEMESHPWYSYKGIGEPYKAEHAADPNAKTKMVTYQLGLFRRGPNMATTKPEDLAAYGKEHLAAIAAQRRLGKILCAGPITDGGDLAGIGVFATTIEEAKAFVEKDAFVSRGIMKVDWYTWYAAEGSFPPTPKQ
jgi:uncharacterized protein YciI